MRDAGRPAAGCGGVRGMRKIKANRDVEGVFV